MMLDNSTDSDNRLENLLGDSRVHALLEANAHLRSHVRIAHLVAATNLDRLIHVAGLGWYVWDDKRFVPDVEDKRVTEEIMKGIARIAPTAIGRDEESRKLRTDLIKCQSASGLSGVARAMSVLKGIRVDAEELDDDPLLLNVSNGVLDLRELNSGDGRPVSWPTLVLYEHHPKYRMTHVTRASFDPDTESDLLLSFFDSSLPDVNVREYLQRALGLGLIGEQIAHLLPILEGTGRNGKGVFYNAIHHALGTYSHIAPPSLFDLTKGDPNRPSPAFLDLRGRRLAWLSETAKAVVMDSALIKRLTGGDPITGRRLHKNDSITFNPSHLLVLVTNHAPRLPADDPAVWARVRKVPWKVVIPESDQDAELPQKMKGAADALLGWMLAGLSDYRAHGLSEPQEVQAATDAYKAGQDTVGQFIDERCEQCNLSTSDGTRMLHMGYQKYCRANQILPEHMLGERDFGAQLDRIGIASIKGAGGRRVRDGLKLSDEFRD